MTISSNQVPLMFRAQIEGRCQIQRLIPKAPRQQAYDWVDQWLKGMDTDPPEFSPRLQTRDYPITWRFVTNSGQDEGVIRPVIGAKGYPYYPGASMKGAFLRACSSDQALRYCGGQVGNDTQPGILRFHGGYPKDDEWKDEDLVDVVHPQQDWQVKDSANHSAFIQMSLYKPTLTFAISSKEELDSTEWETIWQIWETAFGRGIGSRVSAGYGQPKKHGGNRLLSIYLKGEGLASQLIDKTEEFRPNMFKAALRGHTLRLFGGVTDAQTAEQLTKELWGGFAGRDGAIVGKLGIAFNAIELQLEDYTYTPNRNPVTMPLYNLQKGKLDLLGMQDLPEKQKKNLKIFLRNLVKFSMLLGGFGKSWRRVNHQIFFPEYLDNRDKPMIGCHWQFNSKSTKYYCPVNQLEDVTKFLKQLDGKVKGWVKLKDQQLDPKGSDWREAWHRDKVQVWGRIAEDEWDSVAVEWFHGSYVSNQSIKQSTLTGKMGRIGRIWHRMYPRYITQGDTIRRTGEYIELLTIFPDPSEKTRQFLSFLANRSEFEKLW